VSFFIKANRSLKVANPIIKPLNKGIAVLLTVVVFFIAGGLNEAFVLKEFGNLGGLIIDVLGIFAILEIWRRAMKPKSIETEE
jgi:hypothetical protein